MSRQLLVSAAPLLLAACATDATHRAPQSPPAFVEARIEADGEIGSPASEPTMPPGQLKKIKSSRPVPASPERAIEQGAKAARIEPSLAGYVNAVQIYPYTDGALYRLYAAPGQVSDIALEPGETLISVSAGDTVRWVVGDTMSGTGEGSRAHVLVKPISADLHTNLMIATDRRTYHLELESTSSAYMAALSWRYADTAFGKNRVGADFVRPAGALNVGSLNFAYRVEGDRPSWRPIRAFDDGRKVFIEMPEDLQATDAPPLFVLSSAGKAELVNYRLLGRHYVVDRLFEVAELRLGEKDQDIVRIVKGKRK